MGIRIQMGLVEEILKSGFFPYELLKPAVIEAREPMDHLVEFFRGPSFLFHFGNVMGVDRSEGHVCDTLVVFVSCLHFCLVWRKKRSMG